MFARTSLPRAASQLVSHTKPQRFHAHSHRVKILNSRKFAFCFQATENCRIQSLSFSMPVSTGHIYRYTRLLAMVIFFSLVSLLPNFFSGLISEVVILLAYGITIKVWPRFSCFWATIRNHTKRMQACPIRTMRLRKDELGDRNKFSDTVKSSRFDSNFLFCQIKCSYIYIYVYLSQKSVNPKDVINQICKQKIFVFQSIYLPFILYFLY